MANVCTPTTTTEGGGSCTFDPVQPITRIDQLDSTNTREITIYPYVFTARANAGWAFSHFNATYKWDSLNGDTVGPYTTGNITENPFALRDTFGDNPSPINWWYGGWLGVWNLKENASTRFEQWCSLYVVKAVFVRVPTHLLLNSSSAESPAKLVYDPTTNLLVADY